MLKLFVMFITLLAFIYVLSGLEHSEITGSTHQADSQSMVINHELAYPVVNQVKAYNDRNFVDFIDCFSENIKFYKLQSGELVCEGKENLKLMYDDFFKSSDNSQIIISKRFVCGECVIDEQIIRDMEHNSQTKSTVIFEIKDDLIVKVWFVNDIQT